MRPGGKRKNSIGGEAKSRARTFKVISKKQQLIMGRKRIRNRMGQGRPTRIAQERLVSNGEKTPVLCQKREKEQTTMGQELINIHQRGERPFGLCGGHQPTVILGRKKRRKGEQNSGAWLKRKKKKIRVGGGGPNPPGPGCAWGEGNPEGKA